MLSVADRLAGVELPVQRSLAEGQTMNKTVQEVA
jgi:hypothetical protein